jgi:hypothetical protein
MLTSQPGFEMGERAIPVEYLNDKGESKTGEVECLYRPVLSPPDGSEK